MDNFLIVAWIGEPSNGGFFMLRPGPTEFEQLKDIALRNHASRENSQNGFDLVEGWGHALQGGGDTWMHNFENERSTLEFLRGSVESRLAV
jgi:hypothetical protein